MKAHRIVFLFGALACAAVGAVAPATGCNGTGTTPMCDFPDGANNPESGCGDLVEAAAALNDVVVATSDVVEPADSPVEKTDAADATAPESEDADKHDAHDAHEDASDGHSLDGKADAKG